ncbi:lanthionine synthetase C family protein [Kitasatospora viridis]|uniref:Lanthionine synthetase-like protein n=1 Tax=Kitasatospora viridis TaxID=281105 RepID=A0A561UGU7_9ACTN|nr:lanthionine synthetase C family protein [Kitasatospora viridis]TWF98590.1 lanthionine synthetase-like protein [Kitasatospora viridis]
MTALATERSAAPGWAQSLDAGALGPVLAHIEYAHTGDGDWATAHRLAAATVAAPISSDPATTGLFHGAPAVAFTLNTAGPGAYQRALAVLDQHVADLTRHRLEAAHARIDAGRLAELREWDLINGLTGIGAHLLERHGDTQQAREVLAYLVRLTEPVTVNGEQLPGWWSVNGPSDTPSPRWPGGHANFGIAHGIAGPLALLSSAMRRGITVAGQPEAIERICAWLDRWRSYSRARTWWPEMISRTEWSAEASHHPGPQRPSWCYGTPGLARAQQLAGLALADPRRQRAAEDALLSCVRDPVQLFDLSDATLCHGWAGLLLTTWRAAADAADDRLAAELPRLAARFDQHLHRAGMPAETGLLEGTTGIDLVRHTTATEPPTRWDACLLLAG